MRFLDTVERARTFLERNGRVSFSALKIEFDLDDARLATLIDELVDVQQVVAREGKVLVWIGSTADRPSAPASPRSASHDVTAPPASSASAEGELRHALELARAHDSKSLELRIATSLARLWRDHGRNAEARALLQPVCDWFTEGFEMLDLKDAQELLAELG